MAGGLSHSTQGTALSQTEFESTSGTHAFPIEHHVADDTLTKEETGSTHTNLGEDGAMTLTLPQDPVAGCLFWFVVMVAQELRIDPGAAGAIYLVAGKGTDNKYITANAIGESIMLVADGNGDWIGLFETGTWTTE